MTGTVFVRPSAMDRFLACASSAAPPECAHDPGHEAQRGGSAVHHAIELTIQSGEPPDLPAIAAAFGVVDLASVTVPYALWRRAWKELAPYFPEPLVEHHVEGPLTHGTIDLASIGPKRITIADWKAGYIERSHRGQMMAYAHCLRAIHGMPEDGVIRAAVVHLRGESWTVHEFRDAELDGFEAQYHAQYARIGEHYAAGEHCQYCPRRLECETRSAYLRAAGEALVAMPRQGGVSPLVLGALYPVAQQLESALKDYKEAARMAAADGPLRIDDERELCLEERTRTSIRAREAWDILSLYLTPDELAGVVNVSKGAVESAVRSHVGRGEKAMVTKQLMADLRDAGALVSTQHTALTVRKRERADGDE